MKTKNYIFILLLLSSFNLYSQSELANKYLKKFEEAKSLIDQKEYNHAKNILLELTINDSINILDCGIKSDISNKLGVVYLFLDDIFNAFKIWNDKTLPLRKVCDTIDFIGLAQTYYNIGYSYGEFCDYTRSIKSVKKALEIIDSIKIYFPYKDYSTWCSFVYSNSRLIGDYSNAQGYIFKAIAYLDYYKINDNALRAKLFIDLGRNFVDKSEFKLAKSYFDKSYDILINIKSEKIISLYRNYANLYWAMGSYDTSIMWSEKAIKFINEKKINNKTRLAKAYGTLGLSLSYNNESKKALTYYFKALKLIKQSETNNRETSLAYENIAGAFGRKGDLDSALFYINLSINKLHYFNNIELPTRFLPFRKNDFNKLLMVRKLQMKGKFLNNKYKKDDNLENLIKSEQIFIEIDSLIFNLRNDLRDRDSKILLGTSLDTIYKYAIENTFTLWEETKDIKYLHRAYKYVGENKAVVYSETKNELDAVWNILDDSLRNKYLWISEELKSNIFQKQYAVLKRDLLLFQKINTEFLKLSAIKDDLYYKINQKYPNFFTKIHDGIGTKSIKYLQSKLDLENAILEYYIDGNKLYTFVVSKTNFFSFKQEIKIDLDSVFNKYSNELMTLSNRKSLESISNDVYSILFPDTLNDFLKNKKINRLIIIRDKNMNKITFGSILSGKQIDKEYLIFKYAFSYAFNNKYIWRTNSPQEKKKFEFSGYATNYDTKTLNEISKDIIFWIGSFPPVLKPLNQSIDEVTSISKMFNSKIWIKNSANYKNFIENANRSDILHLSLHSLIASDNNEQNGMIFQKTDNNDNFILKSSDLIGLRLNNSLSVLSSCYSSDGNVITAEGINSLARSFSLAGSSSIIASQWQAYEGQTRDILTQFYSNLKKGYSKDISLQKAKQQYILNAKEEFKEPINWANLLLLGDPSPIYFESNSFYLPKILIVFIIILTLLILILLKSRLKIKKN